MDGKYEVVGWLLVDDASHVIVREENGDIALQTVTRDGTVPHPVIQTGSFDPMTGLMLAT